MYTPNNNDMYIYIYIGICIYIYIYICGLGCKDTGVCEAKGPEGENKYKLTKATNNWVFDDWLLSYWLLASTSVCENLTPFAQALALQSSSRNRSPAPDLVL